MCVTAEDQRTNPERWKVYQRRANLKKKFDITIEQYEEMLASQGGVCACCGTDQPGGKSNTFHVDHVHGTKTIRGILCHGCNTGIGLLGDDLQGVRQAVAYLERSELGER